MRPLPRLIGLGRRPMAERGARGKSLGQLAAELAAPGARMDARLARAADAPGHRDAIAHWVGIERWGQRRLRVALGEMTVAGWLAYFVRHPEPESRAGLRG